MNSSGVRLPHPRNFVAHWPDPLSQGDSQACPLCLPFPPISSVVMARTASAAQLREPSATLPCLLNSAAAFIDRALLPETAQTGKSRYGPLVRTLRPFAPARSASVAPAPSACAYLSGTNRLTCLVDPHLGRPFAPPLPRPDTRLRADRFGVFTFLRPAFLPSHHPVSVGNPLICGIGAGRPELRPLATAAFPDPANQLTGFDSLKVTRPFLPSSLSLSPLLRAEQIGGMIVLDLSCGGPGNQPRVPWEYLPRPTGHSDLQGHFPRSNDRQDSTFPRESAGRVAATIFPPVFRVSGTLQRAFASFFHRIRSQHSTS
jgi:hypothetical protein